jgi:hypothetical protein
MFLNLKRHTLVTFAESFVFAVIMRIISLKFLSKVHLKPYPRLKIHNSYITQYINITSLTLLPTACQYVTSKTKKLPVLSIKNCTVRTQIYSVNTEMNTTKRVSFTCQELKV